MRARLLGAIVAGAAATGGIGQAACPPGQLRNCVNLDLVPQISQQIVAQDPLTLAPKAAPSGQSQPYTGVTVGAAPNLRRAPTLGYRWAIN